MPATVQHNFEGERGPAGESYEEFMERLSRWPADKREDLRGWKHAVEQGWTAKHKPETWEDYVPADAVRFYYTLPDGSSLSLWQSYGLTYGSPKTWRVALLLLGRYTCGHQSFPSLREAVEQAPKLYGPEVVAFYTQLEQRYEAAKAEYSTHPWPADHAGGMVKERAKVALLDQMFTYDSFREHQAGLERAAEKSSASLGETLGHGPAPRRRGRG